MSPHPDKQELTQLRAENQALRAQLQAQQANVYHLLHWYRQLDRDVGDIYASVTWRMGEALTRLLLWLLRHPPGPTARDHVERLRATFTTWQQNYLNQQPLLPYTPWHERSEYHRWLASYHGFASAAQVRETLIHWPTQVSFAVIVVAEAGEESASINSLLAQTYPNWWGYIALRAPQTQLPSGILQRIGHPLITHIACADNYADTINQALRNTDEDYVICLGEHDQLAPNALFEFAQALAKGNTPPFLYCDHDQLDANGQRYDPFFKPDWSPDLLVEQNYLGSAVAFQHRALQSIGGFDPTLPGLEHYDAVLRICEHQPKPTIPHVPRLLYHQAATPTPPIQPCVQAHFQRCEPHVTVNARVAGQAQVLHPLPTVLPLLSVIIPTRDKVELLRGTVEGLQHQTDYPALEILIVDNGSREAATLAYFAELGGDSRIQIIREDAAFNFSRLNNLAAAQANGELLALLNNDLQMIRPDWLSNMVRHALREDIGAVGAKLYYPDNTLQHAGVISGLGGLAGHPFKHVHKAMPAYHWRPFVTYNCQAVTAACLVLRKSVFDAVGGFDEQLKVAFNDVDLCLRIVQQGYRNLWTPDAELYHLESVSRGVDDTPRKFFQLQRELAYMRKRWGDLHDPYYNPNLTLQYEDYALAWPPRA